MGLFRVSMRSFAKRKQLHNAHPTYDRPLAWACVFFAWSGCVRISEGGSKKEENNVS